MSARRLFGALALALAAGAALARPARAAATDSVLVQVGGQLAARAGQVLVVPVTIDMRGASGRTLGGYALTLTFDTTVFYYYGDSSGTFAAPLVNSDSVYSRGQVRFTAVLPAGATGLITLFSVQLYVRTDTVVSAITVTPTQLTAASGSVTPFEDLLPLERVVNGVFCRSLGTWGDVDGDGQENSRDALAALMAVVGLPVDTTLMQPALADVDGDGQVRSVDALIIMSHAVGLPVTGRIGQVAAGACGTGNATTLVIIPDSLELSKGQTVPISVRATDAQGRVVPVPGLTWTTSNSNIAAFAGSTLDAPRAGERLGGMQFYYYGPGIVARDAGTAVITATMAPGVSAQLTVVVLPHRRVWYVDTRRATNAPTQVGSAQYPFAFVGDALDGSAAADGDTVLVAGGTYDELVSGYVSAVVLGDSTDRPVIDPRGAPSYYPSSDAVSLGSGGGQIELSHFVLRGGGAFLTAHDLTSRDVDIQMLGGTGYGLELESQPTASLGFGPGRVLVQGVTVEGADVFGIRVDEADSALVLNNTVLRDSTFAGTCGLYAGTYAGIAVASSNTALVQGNTVTDAACVGIEAYAAGSARITGNVITRPSAVGIMGSAPRFSTDHNVVRSVATLSGLNYQDAYGIYVDTYKTVDSASSRGDSIVGVHGYYSWAGLYVAGAATALVDSLAADSIGDSGTSYDGAGAALYGGRIGVSHSRLTRLVGAGIVAGSNNFEFASQGNRIANAQGGGISFSANCDCSVTPDSASSDHDTILTTGSHAIDFAYARVARVQNAAIDSSAAFGVYLYGYTGTPLAAIVNSKIARTNTGISSAGMFTLAITGDSLVNNGTGAYIQSNATPVNVKGVIVSGGTSGLVFWYSAVAMDSSAVDGAAQGFYLDGGYAGNIQRSRFSNDSAAVVMGYSPRSLVIGASNFIGNQVAVDNQENATDTVWVYALGNYWGDPAGPTCDSTLYGPCPGNGTAVGDSLKTTATGLRVDYTGFLTALATPTAAPRAFASPVARRAAPLYHSAPTPSVQRVTRRFQQQRAHQLSPAPAAPSAQPQGHRPFPPAWQKGRAPRTAHLAR